MAPAKKHIYLVPKNSIFIEKILPPLPEKLYNYLISLINFLFFYWQEMVKMSTTTQVLYSKFPVLPVKQKVCSAECEHSRCADDPLK